jgi:hypothetical protein
MTANDVIRAEFITDTLFATRYLFKKRFGRKFIVGNHHKLIAEHLDKVYSGDIKRLMILMPPRYAKTEMAVKTFIAKGLAINPGAKFIHTSYSKDLALDNASEVKEIIQSEYFQELFPHIRIARGEAVKHKWYTEQGGGVYTTSTAGQITGFGAGEVEEELEAIDQLEQSNKFSGAIIIDDPIKPEDAASPLMRDKVNMRFETTIRSRTNSRKTPIILIMQRLNILDLAGYLLEIEKNEWTVLSLPAISIDENGNEKALWEFKHTVAELHKIREANKYVFETQYQQNPKDVNDNPVFKAADIDAMLPNCKYPIAIGDLVGSTNIATARFDFRLQKKIFDDLKFVPDEDLLSEIITSNDPKIRNKERNKLKIWEYPDTTQKITNRYIVSLDPAKGTSEGADNAVVRVFDRYWKMYGGKTELVAQLITKEDKDIVVYKATQIAKWYNDALFVPESNTIESSDRYNEGEFIFDIISDIYNNLYCRSSPEDIRQGIPPKWGWHTNKNTKPMVIANYTAYLREQAYVERDEQCLNEARTYETDKSGRMNAKAGCHDDILMATMIALQIDSELPMPYIVDESRMTRRPKNGLESDF